MLSCWPWYYIYNYNYTLFVSNHLHFLKCCGCLHCLLHLDFWTFVQTPSLDLSHLTFLYVLCGFIKRNSTSLYTTVLTAFSAGDAFSSYKVLPVLFIFFIFKNTLGKIAILLHVSKFHSSFLIVLLWNSHMELGLSFAKITATHIITHITKMFENARKRRTTFMPLSLCYCTRHSYCVCYMLIYWVLAFKSPYTWLCVCENREKSSQFKSGLFI